MKIINNIALVSLLLIATTAVKSQTINWLAWNANAFEKAKTENKLIFVDVGTEWCTACNYMEEYTYTNKEVIDYLNANYICIKVDAEAQPDIGARYLDWGWPALIFMTPNGFQIEALQGNRLPEKFMPIITDFQKNKDSNNLITSASKSTIQKEIGKLNEIEEYVSKKLDSYFDTIYGGWTTGLKMPLYAPVEYEFWKAAVLKDNSALSKALLTLKNTLILNDTIWGGIGFGAYSRDWKGGAPEKRTETQAGCIINLSEAYLATGDKLWLTEANRTKNYLLNFLRSPQTKLFYNSQEENLNPSQNKDNISSEEYFLMNSEQRKKVGIPPIDKTIYTDINFRCANAFIRLYEANNNVEDIQMAEQIIAQIKKYALTNEGWYKQIIGNENKTEDRIRVLPEQEKLSQIIYLRPQVHAGLALLSMYIRTQDTTWLNDANKLAIALKNNLLDTQNSGFYASNQSAIQLGDELVKPKVFIDNALAARFFIELADITENKENRAIAEKTLLSIATYEWIDAEERLLGEYALAVSKYNTAHLKFTIVTSNNDLQDDLFKESKKYYYPAKLLVIEKPGHYPDMGKPALFICNTRLCSEPITNYKTMPQQTTQFITKLKRK